MRYRPTKGIIGGALPLSTRGILHQVTGTVPQTDDPIDENEALLEARGEYQLGPPVAPEDFQGVNIPVQVDLAGRCQLVSGREQTKKLLYLAFHDCDSENEFQRLGLSRDIIFNLNDAHSRNIARIQLLQIGQAFSDRLEVREEDVKVDVGEKDGDVDGHFVYTEIETGKRVPATVPLDDVRGATT